MGKKKGKSDRHSPPSRSSINDSADGGAVCYDPQPPSRASHSNCSNASHDKHSNASHERHSKASHERHSQASHDIHSQDRPFVNPAAQQSRKTPVEPPSSSSSSSSSTMTSESDNVRGHLSLVSRPPPFSPVMMGLPVTGASGPYGGFGPPVGPHWMTGGQVMPELGMGMTGQASRYGQQPDDLWLEERLQQLQGSKRQALVMEHPSLRQFVIFTAILFLVGFVALVVIAVYCGRSTQSSWIV